MHKAEDILSGKWIVNYDPQAINYRQALEFLAKNARKWVQEQSTGGIHRVTLEGGKGEIPGTPIRNVLLCVPFLEGDKRWQSIDLTASGVFLGSALVNHGFEVALEKLRLPVGRLERPAGDFDLLGFTLFEDVLPEFKEFLSRFLEPGTFQGLLAAGGPLATLTPLPAAYHLPEINLWVRGEAELLLPGLLKTLHQGDPAGLTAFQGILFQVPGLIVISELGEINRPHNLSDLSFNLDFLEKKQVVNGLEINLSRGCMRGCVFCSKVQGRGLRKLPPERAESLLVEFREAVEKWAKEDPGIEKENCLTVNINDDDILQDSDYAGKVLEKLKTHGFKLWGIQASLSSFYDKNRDIRKDTVDIAGDESVFVKGRPLIWLGTDAFLAARGKRLGKIIPAPEDFDGLLEAFEKRGIANYHYWICSDWETTWEEFVRECMFIFHRQREFKHFGLLPHSPFLVPYSSTPVYRLIAGNRNLEKRIRYKAVFEAPIETFRLPLVTRLETASPFLNKLLRNEGPGGRGEPGFFDHLKNKDFFQALATAYSFLRLERIMTEAGGRPDHTAALVKTESLLETFLSSL